MLKSIFAVLIAVVGLTLVANAAPELPAFSAKLTLDGEAVGVAQYTEKWIEEDRILQVFELKVEAEPGKVYLVAIEGHVFAKVKADERGAIYWGMKAVRKAESDESKIPVAKKMAKVTVGDEIVGYFESR